MFKSTDQKEVHLKFVTPTNVVFTDTHDADWQNNISWSTTNVPDTDNIVTVQNNTIGGDQRVDVQSANAYADQLVVTDPDAGITVGVKNGNTLSAAIGGITIGQHGAIELGTAGNSLDKGSLSAPSSKNVTLQNGGLLKGNGTVSAQNLVVTSGTVAPGFSVGHLDIDGAYQQGTNGTLQIDVEGKNTGQFDTVAVTGSVQVGGTLRMSVSNGSTIQAGDTIQIITPAASCRANGIKTSRPSAPMTYSSPSIIPMWPGVRRWVPEATSAPANLPVADCRSPPVYVAT